MHRLAPVASVIAGLMLSACMGFVDPTDAEDGLRDLVAARALWNANGVPDYEVVASVQCWCVARGEQVRVTVRGGVVTTATVVATGVPVDSSLFASYHAIEQLFDRLEDAVQQQAYRIDATYDRDYGFPKVFFIDYNDRVADEEYGYEIRSFVALNR